jgi:hypothetical protein
VVLASVQSKKCTDVTVLELIKIVGATCKEPIIKVSPRRDGIPLAVIHP